MLTLTVTMCLMIGGNVTEQCEDREYLYTDISVLTCMLGAPAIIADMKTKGMIPGNMQPVAWECGYKQGMKA